MSRSSVELSPTMKKLHFHPTLGWVQQFKIKTK